MSYKGLIVLLTLFLCSSIDAQQQKPDALINKGAVKGQPRIWNLKSLQKAKATSSESAKLIVRNAEKEMKKTLVTVMDKELAPPSGDKHDYASQGRYWFPNPATADGLPYIRKDGVTNPETEKYDRGSLSAMARSVSCLSLAYYLTSDEKYADKAVENLRIWFMDKKTRMNPNMNFGQFIPGHNNEKGRGEGIIDTYTLVEMLEGIELLKPSAYYTKADEASLSEWFNTYLDWMLTSDIGRDEFEAKNNHGTAFDIQVVRYAQFVGREDVAMKFITEFPSRRLFSQIKPDGSQPLELARTKALGYSVFNLNHFLDMSRLAQSMQVDLFGAVSSDGRSITKAIDFLLPFAGKTVEEFPYKQIADWDKVQRDYSWLLYRAYQFIPNPQYKVLYNKYLDSTSNSINYVLY